jgi:peptide deformylase
VSVRPILLWPDPRLSQVCAAVAVPDADLIADLFDTMYHAKGRGLAAPQIGVMERVFVVDVTWKEGTPTPMAFLNPKVTSDSGEDRRSLEEQCLSIPDLPMPVTRPHRIELEWLSPEGDARSDTFDGVPARCILHELDHLDGRVILDHQTPARRRELEAAYAG